MDKIDRRIFLKIASLSIFGFFTPGFLEVVKPEDFKSNNREITTKRYIAKRWTMAIDLKIINDDIIENCINKCHINHNVPNLGDVKHKIQWIWQESFNAVFTEHVVDRYNLSSLYGNKNIPVLCNQCDNPPCVRVCPTQATFSRDDGIVVMDMHRCIGCRFCMAACPYGSRSFNWTDPRPFIDKVNKDYPTRERGVVEKCDFCLERLDRGDLPICVEESKGSIIFGDTYDEKSRIYKILSSRLSLRRKAHLGTRPQVYYVI